MENCKKILENIFVEAKRGFVGKLRMKRMSIR